MFQKRIRLANTVINVDSTMDMEYGGNLALFTSNEEPDISVSARYAESGEDIGYAKVEPIEGGFAVLIPEGVYPRLSLWQILSILPLETVLMEQGTVILHACYLLHNGEAILFSGPSGIGKSTQGRLWEDAGEGVVINGDRVLVTPMEYGVQIDSHYLCGTSGICSNKSAPLKAIVLLEKGLQNIITPLKPLDRFRQIIAQMSYHSDDPLHRILVTKLAEKLLANTEVIHFSCRKDASAVDCLKEYLTA